MLSGINDKGSRQTSTYQSQYHAAEMQCSSDRLLMLWQARYKGHGSMRLCLSPCFFVPLVFPSAAYRAILLADGISWQRHPVCSASYVET